MNWLRKLFLPRAAEPVANADELREAKALQREHKRHIAAISAHVDRVAERMRDDYRMQDDRLAGRR